MNEYLQDIIGARLLHPECLWLLPAIIPYLLIGVFSKKRGFLATLFRCAAFALLIFALCDPMKRNTESSNELAALVDVSYSVSKNARQELVKQLDPYLDKAGVTLELLPFARQPGRRPLLLASGTGAESIAAKVEDASSVIDTGETDIGTAISSLINHTGSSSVLLLTDGFETIGNARQAAQAAANKGIRLFPLVPGDAVFGSEKLTISSLDAPITVKAGDRAEIRASIKNTLSAEGQGLLQLWLGTEKLLAQEIRVPAGEERLIAIKTPALKGGLQRLRAELIPRGVDPAKGTVERHRWISVKEKSKLLLISGMPDDQRVVKELLQLKGYGMESIVADGNTPIPTSFEEYSSVVLNNASREQLPKAFLPALKQFVEQGGGALLLGGDRSFGLGRYIDTPLEEISPLKFVPPQTKKKPLTVAVILVMDKSGSMAEENRIEAAKNAALMSIQSLRDQDEVAVIGFDHAPFVIIDLERVVTARTRAARRLENLTAAGQTNPLPALAAARQKLASSSASRKHIILMSDGKFPLSSDDYVAEINRLRNDGVSVSTVALGVDADVPFMKILAKYGKGAFYHTIASDRLPQIFVEDIKVSTGELTMKEDQDYAVGIGPSGLFSTSITRYPPLRGFVETIPKKGAVLELITRRQDQLFPILASWNFGRGKVLVFTSDANGRWSLPWLRWPDFPKFWGQVAEQIRNRSDSKAGDLDFDLRYSVNRRAIALDLAVFDDKLRTQVSPKITAQVIQPGGEPKQLVFRGVKKGRFSAILENGRPGDYKLNIEYGSVKFPPLALTIGGESFGEVPGKGINMQNLEELAQISGGSVNPDPAQVTGHQRIAEKNEHLFPPLVLLAFILVLLEAFLREIGLGVLLPRKRTIGVATGVKPKGLYSMKKAA